MCNGLQNNTLNLLSKSWEGIWIGAEDIVFEEAVNKFFKNGLKDTFQILKRCKKSKSKI